MSYFIRLQFYRLFPSIFLYIIFDGVTSDSDHAKCEYRVQRMSDYSSLAIYYYTARKLILISPCHGG